MNSINVTKTYTNIDGTYINYNAIQIEKLTILENDLILFGTNDQKSETYILVIEMGKKILKWTRTNVPWTFLNTGLCTKDYFVLSDDNGLKVPIDRNTGEIVKGIDLNSGERPW